MRCPDEWMPPASPYPRSSMPTSDAGFWSGESTSWWKSRSRPRLLEADRLIAAAQRGGRILQVGHLERFNPGIVAALGALKRPLYFEVHRLGIFTPRSLDIDVVYDVMIHDLDILLALVDAPVISIHALGIPVVTDKVDIAHARLEFASGAVANLTASRVSVERVRKLRFFQEHEYISVDYSRRDALRIRVQQPGPQPKFEFEQIGRSAPGAAGRRVAGISPPPCAIAARL